MEERKIFCYGGTRWTRIIGWTQLAGHILASGGLLFLLIGMVWATSTQLSFENSTRAEREAVTIAIVFLFILLFLFLLTVGGGIFMSVVLLKGTYSKKPGFLRAWITYAFVSLGIYGIVCLGISLIVPYASLRQNLLILSVGVILQGFCICVVKSHHEELAERLQLHPLT